LHLFFLAEQFQSYLFFCFYKFIFRLVTYNTDFEAVIGIDGELLAGALPYKQLKMVTGWLAFHEEEAYKAWNLAVKGEHFEKIEPMK
jgi:hypothetical protein